MRPKPMLICSGLAGAVLASCLGLSPAMGQQSDQNSVIDLQFDPTNTSRRSPLDLFNLQSQRDSKPHFTTTVPRINNLSPRTEAPVAGGPLVGLAIDQDGEPQTSEPKDAGDEAATDAKDDIDQEADSPSQDEANEDQSETQTQLNPDQTLPLHVNAVAISVSTEGVLPPSVKRTTVGTSYLPSGPERGAMFSCVHWQPSLVCHNPLYFEDAMLERHGHVRWGHLQSLASGLKFYSTIPMLPYLKTLRPKHECVYQVGHYRAGSCAPLLKDHLPYDKHAAVVEALALGGFFWAMPL